MRRKIVESAMMGLLAAFVCGMAGCGGGDNTTLTPVGTVVNLKAFESSYTGKPNSASLSFPSLTGTDPQGNTLFGSLSISPAKQVTVLDGNISCYSTVTNTTLTEGGSTLVNESSTKYFEVSNGSFYLMVHSSGPGDSTTYVRTSQDSFSSAGTAKVGDSGDLGLFQGSDGTTLTVSWALNPDVNGGSIFVISETYSSAAMGMMSEDQSYYLDATGNPTRFGFRLNMSDGTYQVSGNKQ
jgi:hypothetical protein